MAGIDPDKTYIMGILHPEPEYPLAYDVFPHIPFARLRWPIENSVVQVEWVIAEPKAHATYYFPIELTEQELREGVK